MPNLHNKLKVLCLHGFYNNKDVMKYQMAYYEYIFGEFIEFHYLDAPYDASAIFDEQIKNKFGGPFFAWVNKDTEKHNFDGLVESCEYVKEYCATHGPFDGFIGFSQGGYVIRTMLKATECGIPHCQISPRFAILIASPVQHGHVFEGKNEGDYPCPVMYIYGKADPFTYYRDLAICKKSQTTVILHEKGHNVPRFVGEVMKTFTKFLNRAYEDKFDKPMAFRVPLNRELKKNFLKHKEQYPILPKLAKM
ncbi:unnamed protein product [Moneuplotes crassus]|uniref:Serine hydrolase domain-containing protein n=1 Tax=Euplotes crassus TaxID=5936 RepID=A0AAD2D1V4_EUPCR|nr:unnamed protein product [Moneuplotes crassus]